MKYLIHLIKRYNLKDRYVLNDNFIYYFNFKNNKIKRYYEKS